VQGRKARSVLVLLPVVLPRAAPGDARKDDRRSLKAADHAAPGLSCASLVAVAGPAAVARHAGAGQGQLTRAPGLRQARLQDRPPEGPALRKRRRGGAVLGGARQRWSGRLGGAVDRRARRPWLLGQTARHPGGPLAE